MPNQSQLEDTCRLMGCEYAGTVRFIWQALEWLGRRSGPITYQEEGGFWRFSSDDWTAEGSTLEGVLAAAVRACHAARLAALEEHA